MELRSRPQTATVYHTASTIHKTPGRHQSRAPFASGGNLRKLSLARAESDARLKHSLKLSRPAETTRSVRSILETHEKPETPPAEFMPRPVPISKLQGDLVLFREVFIEPTQRKLDYIISQGPKPPEKKEIHRTVPEESFKCLFFNLMVTVQPPEGINATSASPLTPGLGWAPSIPARAKTSSIRDLKLKARPVRDGGMQKEAYRAYSMGLAHEEKGNFKESLKHFKRYFFCARLLSDKIGADLALNRLGIANFHLGRFEKSLKFHQHHLGVTHENKYIALYNLGIIYRSVNELQKSLTHFTLALDFANGDHESECALAGQIGVTYMHLNELEKARDSLERCMKLSAKVKKLWIILDCLILLGFVSFKMEDWERAVEYFEEAVHPCKVLAQNSALETALVHVGIARANLKQQQKRNETLQICHRYKMFSS